MNNCPVCNSSLISAFRGTVLGRHVIQYYRCTSCGLLRTEAPHWLDEAYRDAITITDTGVVKRNQYTAKRLSPLLHYCLDPDGAYLDVAGGYGLLVRIMRDWGFDFFWDDKFCNNLMARGFEVQRAARPFTALTAFEVIEHVYDPIAFIDDVMARHGTRTLVFTTELYSGNQAPAPSWWYYSFETGQHICFLQPETCSRIASRLGLRFLSANGIHMLTDRNIGSATMRLVTGKISTPLAFYLRHRYASNTHRDHIHMLQELTQNANRV